MRRSIGLGLGAVGVGVGTFLVVAEGCSSGPSTGKATSASTRALQEVLGKLLDKDPSDAVVTQMIGRGVPTAVKNTTVHPKGSKAPIVPETPEDIACVGGFLIPMPLGGWDAKFRGAKAAFPCGSGDTATTACDSAASATPFPDGDVVLTWTVTTGDARSRWSASATNMNELGTAFTFANNAPEYLPASVSDFYGGTKKWWIGGPVTNGLPTVSAKTATGGDQSSQAPTTARVLVRENAIVFVQPISEVGATPQGFRQSTFLDNSSAVKDWSGDVFPEPRAEAPFPSTGPGCTSGPILIKEDASPPPPRDDAGDGGLPPPGLIGVIPGSINRWNICRGKDRKRIGVMRVPNPDGGEEDVFVDMNEMLRRAFYPDAGDGPTPGTPSPVSNGKLDLSDQLTSWHFGRRSKLGDAGYFPDGGLIDPDGTRLVEILPDGGWQWVTDVATDPTSQASGVAGTGDGVVTATSGENGAKVMFFGKTGSLMTERAISEATAGVLYRVDAMNTVLGGLSNKVAVGGLRTQGATREPWMTILTTPTLDKQIEIVAPIGLPGIRVRDTKATDTSIAMCGSVTDGVTGADQPILLVAKLDDLANVGLFRLTFPTLGANVYTEMMMCELTPPVTGLKWGMHYVGNAEVAPQSYKPFVGTAQVSEDGATMIAQDLALHPVIGAKSFADGCLIATGPQSGIFTHTSDNGASRVVVFDGLNVGSNCTGPDQKPTGSPATATRTQIAARAGVAIVTTTITSPNTPNAPASLMSPARSLTTQLICQ